MPITRHAGRAARRLLAVLSVAAASLAATSCQDTYEELFLNPEQSTQAKVPYLFTQAVDVSELKFGYYEGYYRFYGNINRWAQLTGTVNDDDMMNPNSVQWGEFWRDYYARRAMLVREMEAAYAALPEAAKPQQEAYVVLGRILNAYNTAVVTDLWGDIPYSEAFRARQAEGQNLFPKFDAQEAVYDSILTDLKAASDRLRGGTLAASPTLATQDIFLHGDLDAWQRLANSLRLRYAMRLAEVAPEKARAVVSEVLGQGSPLVEGNDENVVFETTEQHNSWDDRGRATRERPDATYAPEVMVDVMKASNDPRLPIIFWPNAAGAYVGLPSSPDAQPATVDRTRFAYLDSLLFDQNYDFPAVVVSAAEVSLLKSEAYLRGFASGNAAQAYATALKQSVELYHDLYDANTRAANLPPLDQAAVDAFATSGAPFDGTLKSVGTQKWIHLAQLDPYEAWAEFRRLDYPQLPPDRSGGRVLERTVRITYPSSELTNNRQSYEAVRAKDTPTTRVWWDVR